MKRWILRTLTVLLALGGIGLILYPNIRRGLANRQSDAVIREIEDRREESAQSGDSPAQSEDPLYRDMQQYNRQIYEDHQSGLRDAWSYEQPPFTLADYGVVDEAVGYLSIDAMDLQLPLYLGADRENLARGAAVLGNTSMPVGGENTNCVIAGHRGWQGIPMFLEIETLQPGDLVRLDTLWETLWYEVAEIRIISPDEIDAVKIQDGKDLLTLVTCHPYPDNYQRYLVYCQRVEQQEVAASAPEPEPADRQPVRDASQKTIDLEKQMNRAALGLLLLIALGMAAGKLAGSRRRKKNRPGKG